VDGPPGATSTAARPPVQRPVPVARLAAACPLLPVNELKALLGGASQTRLTAAEDKPDLRGGYSTYTCRDGSNGRFPFVVAGTCATPARLSPATTTRHHDTVRLRQSRAPTVQRPTPGPVVFRPARRGSA
jgi:hypothetical protein